MFNILNISFDYYYFLISKIFNIRMHLYRMNLSFDYSLVNINLQNSKFMKFSNPSDKENILQTQIFQCKKQLSY